MQHKSHPKYAVKAQNSRGNALVIILVMIALIAALTAVSMRSSNRSSSNMDKETARIQAERLMRQAKGFESGVTQMLTVNQCSENDVNFLNPTTTRIYTNANSPVSKKCDLFSLEGAGLAYANPNTVIFDSNFSSDSDYGQWVFTASHCVLGLGSDDNDTCDDKEVALMAIVPHVNMAVCMQINELNGIENTGGAPPTEDFDETTDTFDGKFTATTDPELGEGATGANLIKHATGCFKNNSGSWANSYIFYHSLLIR
jgi:type II secretory pathway pseudopilin PulG